MRNNSTNRIEIIKTNDGFILHHKISKPSLFFCLGGTIHYTKHSHKTAFDHNFLPSIKPIRNIAKKLKTNGHNTIKIYLPPNNLTPSDAKKLKKFIKDIYKDYGIKTYILHFAGLYANSKGKFLLNDPTPKNLEKIKDLIKNFAIWAKDLGPAIAGIQLGNENDYYVPGAGIIKFGKINISPRKYHGLMNELAKVYKKIDNIHPVFLGHGGLTKSQIPLLKDNLTNFDGIALNIYPNWNKGRPAKRVISTNELKKYFKKQIDLVKKFNKPIIISEFGESSYGRLGEKGQKEFIHNALKALSKFMVGSKSKYPHLIVGLFWHEYFPEYWKDKEIHPSESGLSLFNPEDNFKAKQGFKELSKGYQNLTKSLNKLT